MKKINSLSGLALLVILTFSATAHAQPPFNDCGDANSSGNISIADFTFVMDYLWNGGPAPLDPIMADMDGYEGLTAGDVSRWYCIFICDFAWFNCNTGWPELVPTVDSAFELRYPNRIPAGFNGSVITLVASSPPPDVTAMTLVLRFRIDGTIPAIDSVRYPYTTGAFGGAGHLMTIDGDSAEIVMGAFFQSHQITSDTIAQVFLSYPSSPTIRGLDMTYARRAPLQAPPGDSSLVSMFAQFSTFGATVPILAPSCCMTAGDANYDGRLTIGDVTFTIARIFSGGPPPQCTDAGDANGDGNLTIGDATHMLNRIFSGGPPAVCVSLGI